MEAKRVGAMIADELIRRNLCAATLAHLGSFFGQDHALVAKAGERLAMIDHAQIAQHFREEPRVEQMQNRVLDAAAVEIDRRPLFRELPDRTAFRRSWDWCSDTSTRTNRRTCPSCRFRAALDRRISGRLCSESVVRHQRALTGRREFGVQRQHHRQLLYRHGIIPQLSQ